MSLLVLETTSRCPRAGFLAFALEEAGLPWTPRFRPDGWFQAHHGRPGPFVHDGGAALELPAMIARLARGPGEAAEVLRQGERLRRLARQEPVDLGDLEARLRDRPFVLGAFSLVDCLAPGFGRADRSSWPSIVAWVARVRARPALAAAEARLAALREVA